MKNRNFWERLGFAIDGLKAVSSNEASFRTQLLCAVGAAFALLVLRPGWFWTALIVLASTLVLALELVNSALEYLMDHVHPDIAPAIKRAKDAAAAAVLVSSFGALLTGLLMVLSLLPT